MATSRSEDEGIDRKTKVFLSYSRADGGFAETLRSALEKAGYHVLMDRTDIAKGEEWKVRLGRLIVESDTVVFCLSPNSAASEYCAWEAAEAERLGKRILPAVVEASDPRMTPDALAKRNFVFFDKDAGQGLTDLLEALEADLPWLREHTRLGDLALQWKLKRGNAGVLRGDALEEAERWIASQPRNAALATDLHREFVAASRRAATSRQRNWIGGAAAVVALSLGLAGWSEVNRREAVRQTAIAETQRAEAEKQNNRAKTAIDAANKAANTLIQDLVIQNRATIGMPSEVISSILEKAENLQKELVAGGAYSKDTIDSQITTLNEQSLKSLETGDPQSAEAIASKALEIAKASARDNPGDFLAQTNLAMAHNSIAVLKSADSLHDDAIENLEMAIEHFNNAIRIKPDNPEALNGLSISLSNIAGNYLSNGQAEQAFESFQKSEQTILKALDLSPGNPAYIWQLAQVESGYGALLQEQERYDEALQAFRAANKSLKAIVASDPSNMDWLWDLRGTYASIAEIQLARNEPSRAIANIREGISLLRLLSDGDANRPEFRRTLLIALYNLSMLEMENDEKAEGLSNLDEALKLARMLSGKFPMDAKIRKTLALAQVNAGLNGIDSRQNLQDGLQTLNGLKADGMLDDVELTYIPEVEAHIAALQN